MLVDPCLSALVAFEDQYDELEDYCQPLKLASRDFVFVPVNDKEDKFLPVGGSHWALLVLRVKEKAFYYYDSAGAVIKNASRIAIKFISLLEGQMMADPTKLNLTVVKECAKQQNSYDCGIYTLLNIKELLDCTAKDLASGNQTQLVVPKIEARAATQMRADMKNLVTELIRQRNVLKTI